MKIRISLSLSLGVIGALCTQGLRAQDSKITSNLGMGMTAPLNPTAFLVS